VTVDIRTIDGEAGTSWYNLSAEVWYQWEAMPGCCARCLVLDGRLVPAAFPAELHPHCRCRRVRVGPGERAPRPFRALAEKLRTAPPHWQVELVGVGVLRLLRAGLVTWEDVAGSGRVRGLAEVVRRRKLYDPHALERAGLHPGLAARAVAVAKAQAAAAAPAVRPAARPVGSSEDRVTR
jgi:hypothetical protein